MLKNIFIVLITNIGTLIIGVISGFIFPKVLSVSDYSQYQTFLLYISYFGILALGLPSGMVLNYAGKEYQYINKKRFMSENKLLLFILLFFSIVFLFIYFYTNNFLIIQLTMSVIPITYINAYKSLFQAWQQFKLSLFVSFFIQTGIVILAILLLLFKGFLVSKDMIFIYILINTFVFIVLISRNLIFLKGIESKNIFTITNLNTIKIGFPVLIGNFMGVMFRALDKQFVRLFYDNSSFAMYSFGMSMQALMVIFITSISQPIFPKMAEGFMNNDDMINIRKLLFVFGSLSGLAFFICAFAVNIFLPRYIQSLSVISYYFLVFPALSVVNCLYINLYKIGRKFKIYIRTLLVNLIVATLMNIFVIFFKLEFYYIALATTITYYIWLFIGTRQFEFLKLDIKDFLFLLLFIIGFLIISKVLYNDPIIGFFAYLLYICILNYCIYGKIIIRYFIIYIEIIKTKFFKL